MIQDEQTTTSQITPSHRHGFNYCFWAKLIVAIPAIPLVAAMAALLFSDPLLQMIAATIGVVLAICLAIKIDQIPALMKMVVNRKT